jgi:hypothetical protein
MWTKGHDKLGAGVTKEVIRNDGTSSPWEAGVTVNPGRGRRTETKNKAAGPGREHVSKSMSTVFGGDRKARPS